MKKILKNFRFWLLCACTTLALSIGAADMAFAAETPSGTEQKTDEPVRKIDELTPEKRKELEDLIGRDLDDLNDQERAQLENMPEDELQQEIAKRKQEIDQTNADQQAAIDGAEDRTIEDLPDAPPEYQSQIDRELNKAYENGIIQVPEGTFEEQDVKQLAFGKGAKACAGEASFSYSVIRQLKLGKDPAEIQTMKVMEPLYIETFANVDNHGHDGAIVKSLDKYESCVASNSSGLPQSNKYIACVKFKRLLGETLRDIELGRTVQHSLSRNNNTRLDMSNTMYKRLNDPVPLFIGQMHQENLDHGPKAARDAMISLVIGCIN